MLEACYINTAFCVQTLKHLSRFPLHTGDNNVVKPIS